MIQRRQYSLGIGTKTYSDIIVISTTISDSLVLRGYDVIHVATENSQTHHALMTEARRESAELVYEHCEVIND